MGVLTTSRAALSGLMGRLRGRRRPRGGTRVLFHDRLTSWLAVFHPADPSVAP